MPWLPRIHTLEQTRAWFEHVVLPHQHVTVAEADGQVLGFSAVDDGWLEQLYVTPAAQGQGVGQTLLRAALNEHPGGLHLHVFARNTRARALYERAGFVCVETSDGSTNEEHEPDCTYAYPPP
nr:GNAT family N-acetyltransferase [uncultured Pseudokineococcus sp.]